MLKGSNTADHLFRIMLALGDGGVLAGQLPEERVLRYLLAPQRALGGGLGRGLRRSRSSTSAGKPSPEWAPSWIIVGLGNPGGRFAATLTMSGKLP